MTPRHWRKPSRCNHNACLEVAGTAGGVDIRDSKHPGGPVLSFTREEFAAHIAAAKQGDYDPLCSEGEPAVAHDASAAQAVTVPAAAPR